MNYLLASCTGFGPDRIKHFLASYSRYATDSKLVVFGGNIPDSTIQSITDVEGKYIDVSYRYKKLTDTSVRTIHRIRRRCSSGLFRKVYKIIAHCEKARCGTSNGLQYEVTGLQSLRYIEYMAFVATLEKTSNVFISDIRDVVFQSEIFKMPLQGLELYAEENNLIGNCPFNHDWMVQALGPSVASTYIDKPVICSGTTAGTAESMLVYLSQMVHCVNDAKFPLGPLDQAFHNHIYYSGRLSSISVSVIPNRTGRVQTMQTQSDYILKEGYLRNTNLEITPVVHQWDRKSSLSQWASIHCVC